MTSSEMFLLWLLGVHFVVRQTLTSFIASRSHSSGEVEYLAGRDTIAILWCGYTAVLAMVFWRVGRETGGTPHWLGYSILLTGTLLRCFGLIALRGFYFATTSVAERHVVIRKGPFRWLRHPLYLGLAIELMGLGVLALSVPITLMIVVLVLEIHRHVRREQRLLSIHLGREYRDFSSATWDVTDLVLLETISRVWDRVRTERRAAAPLADSRTGR